MSGFVTLPVDGSLHLANARVPAVLLPAEFQATDRDGLALVDLQIEAGLISRLSTPAGAGGHAIDLRGSQVWPTFIDVHTHLDKGHIWPRAFNPDGTVAGAVRATALDREKNWNEHDVRRRFEFALRCAWAQGTSAIRTHLDCDPPQDQISWPLFAKLREEWRGRIDLQAVGKVPVEFYLTSQGREFAARVANHGGLLGGVTRIFNAPPEKASAVLDEALDALFSLAEQHQLKVDLHVDETGDSSSNTLGQVARAAIRHSFLNRVVCGHCCSLSAQNEHTANETLDLCAKAKLAVVMLPMINQYLQDRTAHTTPRWRGITLIHELAARGIDVAVASDNCRDPFFAFGDHDMLEVFAQAVRIAHLDSPFGDWPSAATAIPARLMNLPNCGRIAPGLSADLVLFRARSMSELLSRPQSDRVVLRAGRTIDTTLPDYRELDDLLPTNPL